MQKIIEKLRNKKQEQRAFMAMTMAVVVTMFIFSLWSYNFAHSGNIKNLASSAVGVSEVVNDINIKENVDGVVSQFKDLKGTIDDVNNLEKIKAGLKDSGSKSSVGGKYVNVFVNGESKNDVLY